MHPLHTAEPQPHKKIQQRNNNGERGKNGKKRAKSPDNEPPALRPGKGQLVIIFFSAVGPIPCRVILPSAKASRNTVIPRHPFRVHRGDGAPVIPVVFFAPAGRPLPRFPGVSPVRRGCGGGVGIEFFVLHFALLFVSPARQGAVFLPYARRRAALPPVSRGTLFCLLSALDDIQASVLGYGNRVGRAAVGEGRALSVLGERK